MSVACHSSGPKKLTESWCSGAISNDNGISLRPVWVSHGVGNIGAGVRSVSTAVVHQQQTHPSLPNPHTLAPPRSVSCFLLLILFGLLAGPLVARHPLFLEELTTIGTFVWGVLHYAQVWLVFKQCWGLLVITYRSCWCDHQLLAQSATSKSNNTALDPSTITSTSPTSMACYPQLDGQHCQSRGYHQL